MKSRLRISMLLAALSGMGLAGCSNHSAATAPLTPEQLAEQTKLVEDEERAHYAQTRTGAATQAPGQ